MPTARVGGNVHHALQEKHPAALHLYSSALPLLFSLQPAVRGAARARRWDDYVSPPPIILVSPLSYLPPLFVTYISHEYKLVETTLCIKAILLQKQNP